MHVGVEEVGVLAADDEPVSLYEFLEARGGELVGGQRAGPEDHDLVDDRAPSSRWLQDGPPTIALWDVGQDRLDCPLRSLVEVEFVAPVAKARFFEEHTLLSHCPRPSRRASRAGQSSGRGTSAPCGGPSAPTPAECPAS